MNNLAVLLQLAVVAGHRVSILGRDGLAESARVGIFGKFPAGQVLAVEELDKAVVGLLVLGRRRQRGHGEQQDRGGNQNSSHGSHSNLVVRQGHFFGGGGLGNSSALGAADFRFGVRSASTSPKAQGRPPISSV